MRISDLCLDVFSAVLVTASAADNDAAWAGAYAEIVARGGGVIHIPGDSSVYNAVGPWTITQDGVTLVGTGRQNARIDFSAGVGDGIVFTDVDYFGIENVNVRNAAGRDRKSTRLNSSH